MIGELVEGSVLVLDIIDEYVSIKVSTSFGRNEELASPNRFCRDMQDQTRALICFSIAIVRV